MFWQLRQHFKGTASLVWLQLNLFADLQSIIDLDTKIANRAFQLRMTQQQLDGPKISCLPVDLGRLRPPKLMSAVFVWVKPNACDPLFQDTGILTGGEVWACMDTAWK